MLDSKGRSSGGDGGRYGSTGDAAPRVGTTATGFAEDAMEDEIPF